jgi:hypothetical protein
VFGDVKSLLWTRTPIIMTRGISVAAQQYVKQATSVILSPHATYDRLPPIGRPIDNINIYIVDNSGKQLAVWENR